MKVGDIVKIKDKPEAIGALTAIKFYCRLKSQVGDKFGIVTAISGDNAFIQFSNIRKLFLIVLDK